MSNKRDRMRQGTLNRSQGKPTASLSLDTAADEIFGSIGKIDEGRQTANPINIFEILPDPTQPRRVLPTQLRNQWDGSPHTLPQIIEDWHRLVEQERERPFDIEMRLNLGVESEDDHYEASVLEAALLSIIDLAASIKREGLTNPITIARTGNHYHLETGERRWLAFHLLHAVEGGEKWERISARAVEEVNVWRQAFENNTRNDLNAIGMARQIALLIMDLNMQNGKTFETLERFNHERDFYAQVANGTTYPIPYGKADLLLAATGLKNKVQLRQYRGILEAPIDFWEYADDANLTEGEIRYARTNNWKLNVPAPNDTPAPIKKNTIVPEQPVSAAPGSKQHFQETMSYIKKSGFGKKEVNLAAKHNIDEMIRWLEDQKQRIDQYMNRQ